MRFVSPLVAAVLLAACSPSPVPEAPAGPEPVIEDVRFETGNWEHDLPSGEHGASRGYHRAIVVLESIDAGAEIALVRIPWRRPDSDPASKDVLVYDAYVTGEPEGAQALIEGMRDMHPEVPIVLVASGMEPAWMETVGRHGVTPLVGRPTGERLAEAIESALTSRQSPPEA